MPVLDDVTFIRLMGIHVASGYATLSQEEQHYFRQKQVGVELESALAAVDDRGPAAHHPVVRDSAGWRSFFFGAQSTPVQQSIQAIQARYPQAFKDLEKAIKCTRTNRSADNPLIAQLRRMERNPHFLSAIEAVPDEKARFLLCYYYELYQTDREKQENLAAIQALDDLFLSELTQKLLYFVMPLYPQAPAPRFVLENSLAFLFENAQVDALKALVRQIAFTHGVIQFLGFATQNEASLMAVLDCYNYFEYAASIQSAKGIFASFGRLWLPLYREYLFLSKLDDPLLRVIFAVTPALMIVGLIAVVLTPLAFLGVPELALFFVLIPTIFIGLCLASYYASVKDACYRWLRVKYYGGEYALPEYQVNALLIARFKGDEKHAHEARLFYINAIHEVKDALHQLALKPGLSQDEKTRETDQVKLLNQLLLEWVDLHDNKTCTHEDARRLIKARMSTYCEHLTMALRHTCAQEANGVVDDIRARIEKRPRTIQPPTVAAKSNWAAFWRDRQALENHQGFMRVALHESKLTA